VYKFIILKRTKICLHASCCVCKNATVSATKLAIYTLVPSTIIVCIIALKTQQDTVQCQDPDLRSLVLYCFHHYSMLVLNNSTL